MSGDTMKRASVKPAKTAADALQELATAQALTADRIRTHARPWWADAPATFALCGRVILAPFNLAIKLAEGAIAAAVLGVLFTGWAWYAGKISDKDVVGVLKPIGQRLLAMVQSGGTP